MEQQKQKLEIGGVVVFIDAYRMEHKALVTAIHGHPEGLVLQAVQVWGTQDVALMGFHSRPFNLRGIMGNWAGA